MKGTTKVSGGIGAVGREQRNRRVTAFALSLAMTFNLFPAQAIAEALPDEGDKVAVEAQADEVVVADGTATEGEAPAEEAPEAEAEPAAEEAPALVAQAAPAEETPLEAQAEEAPALVAQVDESVETVPYDQADAAIGSNYYATVQDAINAAEQGETVKLLKDIELSTETKKSALSIEEGKEITLDLNGCAIECQRTNPAITNAGTLTIKGDGWVYNTSGGGNANAIYNNGGTLTIKAGTYGSSKSGETSAPVIRNANGRVTVEGGLFTNDANSGTSVFVNSGAVDEAVLTIGGTQTTVAVLSGGMVENTTGTVNITSGEFTGSNVSEFLTASKNGVINVAGGSFDVALAQKNNVDAGAFAYVSDTSKSATSAINISKGEISCSTLAYDDEERVHVSGGYFEYPFAEETWASGYRLTTSETGYYLYTVATGESAVAGIVIDPETKDSDGKVTKEAVVAYYTLSEALDKAAVAYANESAGVVTLAAPTSQKATVPTTSLGAGLKIQTAYKDAEDTDEGRSAFTLGGELTLEDKAVLTLGENVTVSGDVIMGDSATLNVGTNDVTDENNKTTEGEHATVSGTILIGDKALLQVNDEGTVTGEVTTGLDDGVYTILNTGLIRGQIIAVSGTLDINKTYKDGDADPKVVNEQYEKGKFDLLPVNEGDDDTEVNVYGGLFRRSFVGFEELCADGFMPKAATKADGLYRYSVLGGIYFTIERNEKVATSLTGGGYYKTIADALNNLPTSGYTIKLQQNYVGGANVSAVSKTFKLDLNGHTWTRNASDKGNTIIVTADTNVTFIDSKGGGFVSSSASGKNPVYVNGNATFESGAFYALSSADTAVVTSTTGSIIVPDNSAAEFVGKIDTTSAKAIEIEGGFFTDQYTLDAALKGNDELWSVEDENHVSPVEDLADVEHWYTVGKVVVEKGGQGASATARYASLADALEDTATSGTIYLLADNAENVTIETEAKIDLAGKKLTGTITSESTLTLENTYSDDDATTDDVQNLKAANVAAVVIADGGSLTVGATQSGNATDDVWVASVTATGDATLTNNGIIDTTAASAGTLTVAANNSNTVGKFNNVPMTTSEDATLAIEGGYYTDPVPTLALARKSDDTLKTYTVEVADSVTYDGKQVNKTYPYTVTNTAQTARIGDVYFTDIVKAVAAADAGETINLIADQAISSPDIDNRPSVSSSDTTHGLWITKSVVIDGSKEDDDSSTYKISFADSVINKGIGLQGVSASKAIDVTFKDIEVTSAVNKSQNWTRCIEALNYVGTLNFVNATIDTTAGAYEGPIGLYGTQSTPINVNVLGGEVKSSAPTEGYLFTLQQPAVMNILDAKLSAWAILNLKYGDSTLRGSKGSTITFDGCEIETLNNKNGQTNDYGMFCIESDGNTINVTDTEVHSNWSGNAPQSLAYFSLAASNTDENITSGRGVKNNVINLGEGNVIELGDAFYAIEYPEYETLDTLKTKLNDSTLMTILVTDNARIDEELQNNTINISGGWFSKPVPQVSYCADGFIPSGLTNVEGVKAKGYTVISGEQVAYINRADVTSVGGKVYYTTLQDALNDAKNEEIVYLNADVNAAVSVPALGKNKAITLDLNGYNLTSDADTLTVSDGATITVKDSGTYKDAKAERAVLATTGAEASAIVNNGTITINAVAVESGKHTVTNNGTLNITDGNDATVATKAHTTLSNDNADGIVVYSGAESAKATVYGGKLSASNGLIFDGSAGTITADARTNSDFTLGTSVDPGGTYSADFTGLSDEDSVDVPTGNVTVTLAPGYALEQYNDTTTTPNTKRWHPVLSAKAYIFDLETYYRGEEISINGVSDFTITDRWTGDEIKDGAKTTLAGYFELDSTNGYKAVADEDGLEPTVGTNKKPVDAGEYEIVLSAKSSDGGGYTGTTKAHVTVLPYDISESASFIKKFNEKTNNAGKRLADAVNVKLGNDGTGKAFVYFDPYAENGTELPVSNKLQTSNADAVTTQVMTIKKSDNSSKAIKLIEAYDPQDVTKNTKVDDFSGVVVKEYANNGGVNSKASITVVGQGNYTGERTIAFEIRAISLTAANTAGTTAAPQHIMAALDLNAKGGEIKPIVWYAAQAVEQTVTMNDDGVYSIADFAPSDDDVVLTEGVDYRVGYTTSNGITTVNVTGLNNYNGTYANLKYKDADVKKTNIVSDESVSIYLSDSPISIRTDSTGLTTADAAAAALADATLVWCGDKVDTYQATYTGSDIEPALTVVVDLGNGDVRVYTYDPAKTSNSPFDDYFVATSIAGRDVRSGIAYTLGTTGSDYEGTVKLAWDIVGDTPKTKIAKPVAKTGLVYDGTEQEGVAAGEGYTVTGGTATEAGSYTATAALTDKDNTEWADGTTGDLTIAWSIAEPAPKPVDKTALQDEILDATFALLDAPQVSADGSDVSPLDEWVSRADVSAMRKAITDARAAGKAATTQDEVDQALADLVAAEVAFFDATKDGRGTPAVTAAKAHIQTYGDRNYTPDADGILRMGTTGESKRVENITLGLDATEWGITGGLKGGAHVQGIGDLDGTVNADGSITVGTSGQSRRMEAFWLELTGDMATYYDVWYKAHVQSHGDTGWTSNGQPVGSHGASKRMERLEIVVLPKGEVPEGYDAAEKAYLGVEDF